MTILWRSKTKTMRDRAETIALLNLLEVEGVGSTTACKLVGRFGSAAAVFAASESELRSLPRMEDEVIRRIRSAQADGQMGTEQFERAESAGVKVVTQWSDEYPPLLKRIESDAPAVLFVRGDLRTEAKRLAVVGTRSSTDYGKRMSRDLILGLRGRNVHVVSGLASGVDGTAHEAAVDAGLVTEAVFGCGVDIIYPPQNEKLAERILEGGGALVSEYPCGTEPDRFHFPARNRIIAGLAQATLVVEAGENSGALITARLALDYNREVMAVPGAVTNPKTRGCHSLLKEGAALIEKSEDILQILDSKYDATQRAKETEQLVLELPAVEQDILLNIDVTEATHIDHIAAKMGQPVGSVLGRLLMLELKGIVRQLPGKYFVRA